ncbi:uncharacterized protein F5147DRAFT_683494, partial [Suillus discolor]
MEPLADDVQIAAAWDLQYLAATFWTYDYVCFLHEEWTFLRQSRWTRVKVIYIFARYVPFFSMTMDLYSAVLINIYSCFGLISLICSECISLSYGLCSHGLSPLLFAHIYVIPGITGCYWILGGVWYSMSFVLLIISQLGLFSLTLIHIIQSWRTAKGHLYSILVKHNIFYYTCGL